MAAALDHLRATEGNVRDEDIERLSPLSSDTTTYVAWQDSRNGNATNNAEDIYFAAAQHALPEQASDEDDDDVPGWLVVGALAAIATGLTSLIALAVNRRRTQVA